MAEVGLLPFARIALQICKAVLPRYRSRFSKHQFNQPQLLAILCLMRYEDWTFREAEVRLGEHRGLRQALGLGSVPDFTTLYRFLQRLDDVTSDRAVGETVRLNPHRSKTEGMWHPTALRRSFRWHRRVRQPLHSALCQIAQLSPPHFTTLSPARNSRLLTRAIRAAMVQRWFKGGSMRRPIGVTVIAILMILGAALLVLASTACFFVGVLNLTGVDSHDPITAAIVGMALAGGFSLLLLACIYATLGIGVLQLRETARQLCMASFSLGVALTLGSLFLFVLHPPAAMIVAQLLFIAAYVGALAYLVSPHVRRAFTTALVTP